MKLRLMFSFNTLLLILLLLSSQSSYAQWRPEGYRATDNRCKNFKIVPDNENGVWIVWTRQNSRGSSVKYQRVTENGYRLWDLEGVSVLPDREVENGTLMGVETDDQGNIIIAANERSEDDILTVKAQKITTVGDYPWGESGILISNQYDNSSRFTTDKDKFWTCSDEAGGFWVIFDSNTQRNRVQLSGINSDGTIKIDDLIYPPSFGHNLDFSSHILPVLRSDLNGGSHLYYYKSFETDTYVIDGICYCHLDPQGEVYSPYGYSEFDFSDLYTRMGFQLDAIAMELDQSYLFKGDYNLICCHGVPDSTAEWNNRNVNINLHLYCDSFSGMVAYSDSSIGVAGWYDQAQSFSYQRVLHNGEKRYQLGRTLFIESADYTYIEDLQFSTPIQGGDRCYAVYKVTHFTGSEMQENLRVRLMNSDGDDLWPTDSVMVFEADPELDISNFQLLTRNDDLILGVMVDADYLEEVLLFKITPEGEILDYSNDVEDTQQFLSPQQFEITGFYPNPFNKQISFDLSIGQASDYLLRVFNVLGQEVAAKNYTMNKGENRVGYSMPESLSTGIYYFVWQNGEKRLSFSKTVYLK